MQEFRQNTTQPVLSRREVDATRTAFVFRYVADRDLRTTKYGDDVAKLQDGLQLCLLTRRQVPELSPCGLELVPLQFVGVGDSLGQVLAGMAVRCFGGAFTFSEILTLVADGSDRIWASSKRITSALASFFRISSDLLLP